jgi:LacI family transcriptional regulator
MSGRPHDRASITDVARHAGVSLGTVSHVLNHPEKVAPRTRERVLASIATLGYMRSESARQLRMGRGRTVGLVVLDMRNPFFTDLARGAQDAASDAGLQVILCNTDERPEKEEAHLLALVEHGTLGVLVIPSDSETERYDVLRRQAVPVVFVDRTVEEPIACSVGVDDVEGAELAVRHLLSLGHRRIAMVVGPQRLSQVRDRILGARRAAEEAGLPEETVQLVECPALTFADGLDAAQRILGTTPRPTAVFCANDLAALGVLQVLTQRGISVPTEMSLVGYDDIDFAAAAAVPLTSVRQPSDRIGHVALELLLAEVRDRDAGREHEHNRVIFKPELVVRSSSGPAPATGS